MLSHETSFTKQLLVQSLPTQKSSKKRHNDLATKSKLLTSHKVASDSMAYNIDFVLRACAYKVFN